MFENELLSWIVMGAVALSLILSIITLILQILRGRSPKQKSGKKGKAGLIDGSSISQQGMGINPYPAPPPQAWIPPVNPVVQENHTEPLFSAASQYSPMPGGVGGPAQYSGYKVSIKETAPMGERSYEVIVSGEFPIGRSPSNGLQIDDSTVSGSQCVLIAGPDCVFVSNKSNSNITLHNGAKLTDTRPLRPGDTLYLGKVQLYLLDIRKS